MLCHFINSNLFSRQSLAKICLITNVEKIHEQDKPAAQALQSKLETNSRRNNKKQRKYINTSEESSVSDESGQSSVARYVAVKYPKRVTINRKFTFMARVTQPNISRPIEPTFLFNLTHDTSAAFGITETGGIVYISNATAIQNNSNRTYQ